MAFSLFLILHICGAVVGLLSGWAGLLVRKGSRLHRSTGTVFFISMLVMSGCAVCLALAKQELVNIIAGVLTFYMVATAWLTVKRNEGETGLPEFGAMLMAFTLAAACLLFGRQASQSPTGLKDGYPAVAYFIFGSVALLSAALDVRMLVSGGVFGALRIARHLWRMCFALFITTLSFFLGKQRLFPEAVLKTHLNLVPILLVAILMIFWLCRVLLSNRYKKVVAAAPGQTAHANNLA
jgi:hypothetical protein